MSVKKTKFNRKIRMTCPNCRGRGNVTIKDSVITCGRCRGLGNVARGSSFKDGETPPNQGDSK